MQSTTANPPQIKCIDLSRSNDPAPISEALQTLGFLSLKAPGSPSQAQIERIFEISKRFFIDEHVFEKEKVGINIKNEGWVKVRQEK